MNLINYIVEKIYDSEDKNLKNYSILYLLFIVITVVGLEFFFNWKKNKIYENGKKILEKKIKIESLFNKKLELEELKNNIDKILKENENFRLKDYLNNILSQNNYLNHLSNNLNDALLEQPLKGGYTELIITFELLNLTTKDIINIVKILDSNNILYIKEIHIQNINNMLKLVITIATIKKTNK